MCVCRSGYVCVCVSESSQEIKRMEAHKEQKLQKAR